MDPIQKRDQEAFATYFAKGKAVSDFIGMIMRLLFIISICLLAYNYMFKDVHISLKIVFGVFLIPGLCLTYAMFYNITMIATWYLKQHFGFPSKINDSIPFMAIVFVVNFAFCMSAIIVILAFISRTMTF